MKITVEFTLDEFEDYQKYLKQKDIEMDLNFVIGGVTAANYLKKAGLLTVQDLISKTEFEVFKIVEERPKILDQIKNDLAKIGKALKI